MAKEVIIKGHGKWEVMKKAWEAERRPGWLVLGGGKTYTVIVKDGEPEFHDSTNESFYESTSF